MKRLGWILAVLLVSCGAPADQAGKSHSTTGARTDAYAATLDTVWDTLVEGYFDPTFGGLDWKQLRNRYRDRIVLAENDSAFYVTLNDMLFQLGVSHLGVIPREHPEWIGAPAVFSDGDVGIDVRILDDAIVIFRVDPGSPAAVAGLAAGHVISAIDGRSLHDLRAEALAPPRSPLDERTLVLQKVQGGLYGAAGATITLEFSDGQSASRRRALERRERPGRVDFIEGLPPAYLEFEAHEIGDDLGYIRFNSFHPALLDTILATIGQMRANAGIIFDLRGNPGGVFPVRRAIAEHLVRSRGLVWRYQHRDGVRDIVLEPAPGAYGGAVAILTDASSASSSEEFAGALQAVGRAVVVGERTPGIVLTANAVELPVDATLVYPNALTLTADGIVLEGRGVIPDLEVQLDQASLAAGRDPQLEAAVQYLRRSP